ncbi:MAG: hydroxyisourate hydrolase [Alphaproteobacteria bacterium]|nr:MAG: hydroxyisourate hydrolase [Alphaproteobacteria bacterium]
MGKLTTHILDTASGLPGENIQLRLYRCAPNEESRGDILLITALTNEDGRCNAPLLEGDDMQCGTYRLEFDVADYYRAQGLDLPEPPFLDIVDIRFGISDADSHYHVPLLVSPYGYSTYRGS